MAEPARTIPFPQSLEEISERRMKELAECADLAKLPLQEAAELYLESRRGYLGDTTLKDYRIYVGTLVKFFGNVRLERLANPDLIRAYQMERIKSVGAQVINHETSLLQQMLKRIRRWHEVKPFYEPIPLPKESPGRALSAEEQDQLLKAGAANPQWAVVYWATVLALHTATGPGEITGLRLRDIAADDPETARIYVHEHIKNKHRMREVPLNADARKAVIALVEIARAKGATKPEHCLFPYRTATAQFDPLRPGKWPRGSWREMTAAAGVKLRPYDLRHTALTKLAEKNPEQVVIKIAGHVSHQMLGKIYAHVRMPAQRAAVNSISSRTEQKEVKNQAEAVTERAAAEQAVLRAAAVAKEAGIPVEKALQLIMEYERAKGGK